MRYTLEIQKLINRADQENIHPKDAVKLLLEAIAIADANDDVEFGYELRDELLNKGWGMVQRDEFVSAFSWMLDTYDEDPENYAADELLWKYKWIINELFSNPDVTLEQIGNVLEDFKRRLEEQGYGLRSYYSKQLHEALAQADQEKIRKYIDLVNAHPIDELSDCRACEMDSEVSHLIEEGNFAAAYEKALPLLQKQYTCAHVPIVTFCQLCYMAIKNNEHEKAAELFAQAEENLQDRTYDSMLITAIGFLIVYLFHTDTDKGWHYFEKYVPWAMDSKKSREFFFALYMTEALQKEDAQKTVTLSLPVEHPLFTADNRYTVQSLLDFYRDKATERSLQFDQRNGNTNFTIQLKKVLV